MGRAIDLACLVSCYCCGIRRTVRHIRSMTGEDASVIARRIVGRAIRYMVTGEC